MGYLVMGFLLAPSWFDLWSYGASFRCQVSFESGDLGAAQLASEGLVVLRELQRVFVCSLGSLAMWALGIPRLNVCGFCIQHFMEGLLQSRRRECVVILATQEIDQS